jgi:phosphate transport system substrate-binding protein
VEGVPAEYDTIASGKYPISRPLFFYVKKAHIGVIPGIAEFLNEFSSEKAWGPEGYLSDRGLISMPDAERAKFRDAATKLNPMTM